MKSKSIFLIIQIVAWLVFIIFPAFVFSTIQPALVGGLSSALEGIVILHCLLIVFYYFNYYYAIPKYYFAKNYKTYFLILISILLVMILVMKANDRFSPFSNTGLPHGELIFISSIVIRFIMIFLLSQGIASYNRLKQTEEGKLKAELSYLKAQINPHFLFNTLNSIYALTVKKSDNAPESITKLSAIMRYSITDAAQDFVALDKELNYLNAYIELEKLRLTDKVKLSYKVNGDPDGMQIAPLIFIPFVENAFKYGVSTQDNSEIKISIVIGKNDLTLTAENIKTRADNKNKLGLGISNTKKRLSLLYPGKYTLEINDSEKKFSVKLNLILND